ncbi:MAG: hypothetical protein Q8878_03925 [Bacillota bacterium]|nr:hypothetical protein [Bacillota bacterium]
MKNNSLSWVGNKVFDQNSAQQVQRPIPPEWSFSDNPPFVPRSQQNLPQPPQTAQPPLSPAPPETPTEPMVPEPSVTRAGPPSTMDIDYIPGYLASNIGRNMRAEFIIGTNQYADRTGRLVRVGANYFVLEDVNSRTLIMCDLYSVKFVTIIV